MICMPKTWGQLHKGQVICETCSQIKMVVRMHQPALHLQEKHINLQNPKMCLRISFGGSDQQCYSFIWTTLHWFMYRELFTIQELSQLQKLQKISASCGTALLCQSKMQTLRLRVLWSYSFFQSWTLRKPSPSFQWVMSLASSLYKSPSSKRGSPKTTRSIASKVLCLELFKIYYKHSCTNVSAWKRILPN